MSRDGFCIGGTCINECEAGTCARDDANHRLAVAEKVKALRPVIWDTSRWVAVENAVTQLVRDQEPAAHRQALIDQAVRNCRRYWGNADIGNIVYIAGIRDYYGLHDPDFLEPIRAEFRRLEREHG